LEHNAIVQLDESLLLYLMNYKWEISY